MLGPFAVLWTLLYLQHVSSWHSQDAELFSWIASLAAGAVGICLLPIKRLYRALIVVPYVAAMAVATFMFSLPFVCGWFGDCL